MRIFIIITFLSFISTLLYAQKNIDNKNVNKEELLNYINNDINLRDNYENGMRNIQTANGLGIFSLVFITADVLLINASISSSGREHVAPFFLSTLAAIITGITGTIVKVKGKRKVRDSMNAATRKIRGFNSTLNIESTRSGIGLVYTF